MTYEMEYTTYIFACAARGEKAQPPRKEVDWNRIVSIAVEQSITYTVALAIKNGDLGCPNDIKNRLTSSLRGAAIKNSIRTEGILTLVDKMNKAGIKTAIIKGIDAARFYANPECRVSSDADLLISLDDEDRAVAFLENNGFTVKPHGEKSNHDVATHPTLGMVELHISLLSNQYIKLFPNVRTLNESAVSCTREVELGGKCYRSLEPTENLTFLTLHMVKHLLFNGISLRMMMDNALYAKNNLESIDAQRYESALKGTTYLYAVKIIFGAMVKYAGFEKSDFPIEPALDDEEIDAVMTDLEASGWQGFNIGNHGGDRAYAFDFYRYKAALSGDSPESASYVAKDHRRDNLHILFLPMNIMNQKYPTLKQHPSLYPVFWTHRLLTKGVSRLVSGDIRKMRLTKNESNLTPAAKDKIKLFKKLKIM